MIGVEDEKVQTVMQVLRDVCGPAENGTNRATIFGVDMPFSKRFRNLNP